jgi:hypothetical protein
MVATGGDMSAREVCEARMLPDLLKGGIDFGGGGGSGEIDCVVAWHGVPDEIVNEETPKVSAMGFVSVASPVGW